MNPSSLKSFALNMGIQFALDAIKGYVLYQIKDFTAVDCYRAITEDVDLWVITPDTEKQHIQNSLIRKLGPQIIQHSDKLTPEVVLTWIKDERPDFASIVINYPEEKGIKWFEKQVNTIIINVKKMVSEE